MEYHTHYPARRDGQPEEAQISDIVIGGVSGRFPESSNVDEFAANLFAGVDMVTETERRWPSGLFGLPARNGTLKSVDRFDAGFFGIHAKQVDNMDPALRLLLEVSYEAIYDAGVRPSELRGTRTGVFVGASGSDSLVAFSRNPHELSGYSMSGCASSMLANRLSFYFDFNGPSYVLDTACSSSLFALDAAMAAMRAQQCDYALVAGVNLIMRPHASLQFQRLGMLSPEGMCRSFDADGHGYVRSETVGAVFLQRKVNARRIYATLIHSKVNTDGAKPQGITFPSGAMQRRLLVDIYSESGVDPLSVGYVEAHGTGTKAGDPQELNSIADTFTPLSCTNKNDETTTTTTTSETRQPLLIGSTKSNMGHPEPASGIAALAKMLIAIQRGLIPANLHFSTPNAAIPALHDGRFRVVAEHTRLDRHRPMALNSFGFGGANAHLVLQPNCPPLQQQRATSKSDLLWHCDKQVVSAVAARTRLFVHCARTLEALERVLDQAESEPLDLARHALLNAHACDAQDAALYPYRGYTLLNGGEARETRRVDDESSRRPVWFVFSGMGTQWPGMARDLMRLDEFARSMRRSARILRPYYALDLVEDIIMSKPHEDIYKKTTNAFVAIASIQIALVDCLRRAGVQPDGIVGHSVGELGCAYADGCFTAEETLLAAFYRGKCIEEATLPAGGMAAVGLTWQQCHERCPEGVVPACHNSRETVTISGPKQAVADFVAELKAEGVFAKEVDSSNVAFHSYYMTAIAPALKSALSSVLRAVPVRRSAKWISSSVPESEWQSELALTSSAAYHVNNLCSPVLFQEALQHVPVNAITIEIAPHALLQAVLKRSLLATCSFVGLMRRQTSDSAAGLPAVDYLLTQLGRLYVEGVHTIDPLALCLPLIDACTPTDEQQATPLMHVYPVPVETGFLSPLVGWDHEHEWRVPKYTDFIYENGQEHMAATNDTSSNGQSSSAAFTHTIDMASERHAYLSGHQIDGRCLYPATGYLFLVWKSAVARHLHTPTLENTRVLFDNVEIHRATILHLNNGTAERLTTSSQLVHFTVTLSPSGHFELTESGALVARGSVRVALAKSDDAADDDEAFDMSDMESVDRPIDSDTEKSLLMESGDVYKELRLRGYEYKRAFRPIGRVRVDGTVGELLWPSSETLSSEEEEEKEEGADKESSNKLVEVSDEAKWIPFMDAMLQMCVLSGEERRGLLLPTRIRSVRIDATRHLDLVRTSCQLAADQNAKQAKKNEEQQTLALCRLVPVGYDQHTRVVVSGGVEIAGLHATPAPRRQQTGAQAVCVERVEFVPYTDDDEVNVDSTLADYMRDVEHLAEHLTRRVVECTADATLQLATPPLASGSEMENSAQLLRLLAAAVASSDTTESSPSNVLDALRGEHAFARALQDDERLNVASGLTRNLKALVDICLENRTSSSSGGDELRVLEVLASPPAVHTRSLRHKMARIADSHPQLARLHFDYVCLNTPHPSSSSQQQLSTIDWPIRDLQSGELRLDVPEHVQPYDLLIFNDTLCSLQSTHAGADWLQLVVERLVKADQGGFVLVHDYNTDMCATRLARLEEHIYDAATTTVNKTPTPHEELKWSHHQLLDKVSGGRAPLALKHNAQMSSMRLYGRHRPAHEQAVITEETTRQIVIDDDDDEVNAGGRFGWLERLQSALNDGRVERVWLVARKASSGIVGLVNCVRKESGGAKVRCLFIEEEEAEEGQDKQDELFDKVRRADLVMNVMRRHVWGSYRHVLATMAHSERDLIVRSQTQSGCDAFVNVLSRGDLSSLSWMQSADLAASSPHRLLCDVSYAALNFRDIMLATGKLAPEAIPGHHKLGIDGLLGMEFSGTATLDNDDQRRRCMGIVSGRGLATRVRVHPRFVWSVPAEWSLEEAASVPVAYSTAYYALVVRGRLRRGESVLVHAGSGAVGQAAIAIALSYACRVFTTVSTEEKRAHLTRTFAHRRDEQGQMLLSVEAGSFASSRHAASFERHVMRATSGRGVDLVLNSLADDKLHASVRLLAKHARFLEIGKVDLNADTPLGLAVFLRNVTFHGILLDSLFDNASDNDNCDVNEDWTATHRLVDEGIRAGVVRPLRTTCFDGERIEAAFRFMAQGKHIGKVLIRLRPEGDQQQTSSDDNNKPLSAPMPVMRRVCLSPHDAFVLTGGLGGFGLELAEWLVERGARHLVLTSRTANSRPRTAYQSRKLERLSDEYGAKVLVTAHDVADRVQCEQLLAAACGLAASGKCGGVFHLAAVLADALLDNQTPEMFERVCGVKCEGAVNLDACTRSLHVMSTSSAYFVVFSSVTSGRGNAGQANYGLANSAMERVCATRRRETQRHALAVQWGAIGDVGLIVDSAFGGDNDTCVGGTMPQRIASCLRTLEHLLLVTTTMSESESDAVSAIWSSFVPAAKQTAANALTSSSAATAAAVSGGKSLVEAIANVLGLKDVRQQWRNEKQTLAEMGLDSLMSVEIKQLLEQRHNLNMSAKEIQALSMEKIKSIEQQQQQQPKSPMATTTSPTATAVVVNPLPTPDDTPTQTPGTTPTKPQQQQQGETAPETTPLPPSLSFFENSPPLDRVVRTTTSTTTATTTTPITYLMPTRIIEKLNEPRLVVADDSSHHVIYVIHPIEGHAEQMRAWAEHMHVPVYGVQHTSEALVAACDSIESLAAFYWRHIDEHAAANAVIHLCGYSFGASVAFEMASSSSSSQRRRPASLSLLDGSHSFAAAQIDAYKSKLETANNEAHTESEALFTFAQQFVDIESRRDFLARLRDMRSLDDRVTHTLEHLMATTPKTLIQFDRGDLEQAMRAYLVRLVMSMRYKARKMPTAVASVILLVKCSQPTQRVRDTLGDDYDLSEVYEGRVDMRVVDGDHRSFLNGTSAASVATHLNEFIEAASASKH